MGRAANHFGLFLADAGLPMQCLRHSGNGQPAGFGDHFDGDDSTFHLSRAGEIKRFLFCYTASWSIRQFFFYDFQNFGNTANQAPSFLGNLQN